MTALPGPLASILAWLHAGYPEGVPPTDYVPLLALLRRNLSDEQVRAVADSLLAEGSVLVDGEEVSKVDIGVAVTKVTNEMPSEEEVRRVARHLAEVGHLPDELSPLVTD